MSFVITPKLCKAARILLDWSQEELSARSGVSIRTLTRFETGSHDASSKVSDKLYRAFSNANIEFIAANSDDAMLDGIGLRWKPERPHNGIKIV